MTGNFEAEIKAGLFAKALDGEETAEIYRREARAVYESDRIAAAALLLDAAYANEHDEACEESILRDLNLAVQLAPNEVWILETAHRLFMKLGYWQQAAEILKQEFALSDDADYREAVAVTLCDSYWIAGGNLEAALPWAQTANELQPTNFGALYLALWLNVERGDAQSLARAQTYAESLAKILGTPEERAILYGFAGNLQHALGKSEQAYESYRQAAQADKKNPYVLLRYAILCEKYSKYAEAAVAYSQLAQIVEDAELQGTFYHRAGAIHGFIGQTERESYDCAQAYQCGVSQRELALNAADAYALTGNFVRAIEFEHHLIDMSDDAAKAAHWHAIADLCLAGELDDAQRQNALEAAAKLTPAPFAFVQLAPLYEKNGDHDSAAYAFGTLAELDPWARDFYRWIQGVFCSRGNTPDESRQLLAANPCGLGKIRLLLAYEDANCHELNARFLESWMLSTKDNVTRLALLTHLLNVLNDRLHMPDIAVQYLRDLPQTEPSRALALERILLFATLKRWDEVVAGLLRIADETTDEDEAIAFQMDAALYLDFELRNVQACLDLLLDIHTHHPAYAPAIAFIHHLALRERRYDLLIQANAWRNDFQMSAECQSRLAIENAWASIQSGNEIDALSWFEKARQLAPLDDYALGMCIRVLKKRGQLEDVAQWLAAAHNDAKTQNGKSDDDALKQNFTQDEAESVDLNSKSQDTTKHSTEISPELKARQAYNRDIESLLKRNTQGSIYAKTYAESPDLYTLCCYCIEQFQRDASQRILPDIRELVSKLSTASEEVLAFADWIHAERLRNADIHQKTSVGLLLKRSLSRPYGNCLRADFLRDLRQNDSPELIAWLETYARQSQDRWFCEALRREAALRVIWCEGNDEHVRKILSGGWIRESTDRRMLWMLEHFSAISEDWQALGFFRERLASIEFSSHARAQVLKSALMPYLDDDKTSHAVRVAQECIKIDSHALAALITLAHIAEDEENAYSLSCIADRLSEASRDPENRLSYGLWAAQIWSKALHNPEQAVKSLSRILAIDPGCLRAITMIESLLTELGRFERLGRIYTLAVSAIANPQIQIDLLRKHAALLAYKLKDIPGATLSLAQLLEIAPNDENALRLQADLLVEQARWSESVDILERLSKVADSQEAKREIHLRLADILIHHLEQPDKARRLLRRHLSVFAHDRAALNLLYDISCAERQWNEAKATLEEICRTTPDGSFDAPPEDIRKARLAFTRIAREAGWNHDLRTLYEREALNAVLMSRDDFDALVDDYRQHNEIPRLLDVAKRELSQQGNADAIAQYRGCIAALYVANQQHREALAFLSEIIHDSQNTDWAYLARAQALAHAGQIESSIGEFRRTLKQNIALDDAFDPFIDVLKQTDDAISLAAVEALKNSRTPSQPIGKNTRCTAGAPRGFFDIELIPLSRSFADAQRYLRMMTPYAYDLFDDDISSLPLTPIPWAQQRCHQLFGQNFDTKHVYAVKSLKNTLCRIKFDEPSAFVVDERILNESNPIEFDFWAGYAMHQAVTGASLLDALDDNAITALFSALCESKPENPDAQQMKKRLFKILPRQSKKIFKDGVPFLMVSWQDFRRAMQTRAACLGAVLCASPACALNARPNDPAFETFLISENYMRLVKLFWT